MPEEGKNMLKYYHGEKSLKSSFVIYADFSMFANKGAVLSK